MFESNDILTRLIEVQNLLHTDGENIGALVTRLHDTIEHIKAQKLNLSGLLSRLHNSLEEHKNCILFIGADGTILYANPKFYSALGYSPDNFPLTLSSNHIHPDDLTNAIPAFTSLINQPLIPQSFSFRLAKADGSFIQMNCCVVNLLEHDGFECFAVNASINTQIHEASLQRREQNLQTIQEQAILLKKANDAIIERNLDNRIIFWNTSAEKIFGWTSQEAIGRDADSLLFKEITQELNEANMLFEKNKEWRGELKQVRKDGATIITQNSWTLVELEGRPKSRLDIIADITEKKHLETQFLRAQRMESIGTLASGVAHDLNNILSPILLSIDVIRKRLPDEASQRMLTTMELSARRGSDLVKQVLSFGKGAAEGEKMFVKLHHLVKELESIIKETFPKSITFRSNVPKTIHGVLGNPTQLNQVLMNLCVNARDAMPYGGNIEITAENFFVDKQYARMHIGAREGNFVLLSVTDTGKGIPPEIIERIFEPFFTTKEPGKGTGLGLSTVSTIVKSHSGFINVYSEPGMGTTFKIYLPVYEHTDDEKEQAETTQYPSGNGELILVVDDETAIREITKTTLETFGYRVITANDGAEAIAAYVQQQSDIVMIITDMMMPYMDGAAAVRTFRRINPQIKILCISGLAHNGKILQEDSSGMIHFLQKPFTSEKLLKTMQAILAMTPLPSTHD